MIRDFTDEEARRALRLKWGTVDEGVLPAWVAEMDYALAPVVQEALVAAVETGVTGYPQIDGDPVLGAALAGFADRHWGWQVDPRLVRPTSDVTAGLRVAIEVLSEPAPVVVTLPSYPPQLHLADITGRKRLDYVLDPDQAEATIDLDRLDHLLGQGARTLVLTQPHNPWGRVFTRAELEGIRDVVLRHDARVVSDEIHAPLVLPGATHVPYLSLEGTADHAVAVVAASKAFNTAGLRCAQIVAGDAETMRRIRDVPDPLNDSWSPLGEVAAVAAYTDGDEWLASLLQRLDAQRTLLVDLLATHLPGVRMRPLEATYLAWLDARSYGHADPAAVALERGRVKLGPGHDFHPGLEGHVRLNIATSPERLQEIVRRLGTAWGRRELMRTIGMLGGMSWESTAVYYRLANELVRERLGGLHSARVVLSSVDFAEIEELQVSGDWERAGHLLAAEAGRLELAGADLLVLCTNTMHKVADAIEAAVSIPLLHLGDVTAAAVRAAGLETVGLLGTDFTMSQDFYRGRLESHGLRVLVPGEDDRALVHRVIYDELCLGVVREESRRSYAEVVERLVEEGAQGIILGCTEIELLIGPDELPVPSFPTTRLHVEAAVAAAVDEP